MVALQSEIYSAYPNDFAYSGLISASEGFTIAFAGDIPAGAEAMLATATSPYSVETNVGFTEEDMNELTGTIAEVVHPLFPELGVEVGAEPADRVFAINISMGGNSSVELCESIVSAAVADAVATQLTADGVDFFDFGFEVTTSWTMVVPA
ncbi:MAG: hypothetical protein JWQ43_3012 [Glaciihabitans sp.]|nr:hypothetical protein [Glaciihabitans sp.]